MSVLKQLSSYFYALNAKHLVFGTVFALLFVLSVALGLASRQEAGAKLLLEENVSSTSSQTMGTAPGNESMGAAPAAGTQSMGTVASKTESIGSAPTAKSTKTSKKQPVTIVAAVKTTTPKSETTNTEKPAVVASEKTGTPQEKAEEKAKETPKPAAEKISAKGDTPELAATETLPTTGPGQVAGLFAGTSLFGFLGHKLYLRRKS